MEWKEKKKEQKKKERSNKQVHAVRTPFDVPPKNKFANLAHWPFRLNVSAKIPNTKQQQPKAKQHFEKSKWG